MSLFGGASVPNYIPRQAGAVNSYPQPFNAGFSQGYSSYPQQSSYAPPRTVAAPHSYVPQAGYQGGPTYQQSTPISYSQPSYSQGYSQPRPQAQARQSVAYPQQQSYQSYPQQYSQPTYSQPTYSQPQAQTYSQPQAYSPQTSYPQQAAPVVTKRIYYRLNGQVEEEIVQQPEQQYEQEAQQEGEQEQQEQDGEQQQMVGGQGGLGPAWTRGEMEPPAGVEDMGEWTRSVYTEEQQQRLGVNADGQAV